MIQNYFQRKNQKHLSFVAFIIILLLNSFSTNAQTTLIDPATVGGFETGTTFATNGWTATAGTNKWIDNTGATAGFTGARCAYINNTATNHNYAVGTASVSHFYRDVTIPAGESNIALSFKWIGQGESCCDRLRVWVVPTTITPVAGTALVASGVAPTGNIQIGADMNVQAAWVNANLTLPTAYAGTTVRLVFEWRNDGSVGTQPPAAVDNISLVSAAPTAPCTYSATSGTYWISNVTTTGGFTNFNNATAFSVGGYGDYYTSQSVNQMATGTINFTVAMSSGSHGINVYVDWNNDFDFADVGEKVYASGAAYVTSATGSFIVPGAQAAGNYRMRVVSHYLNTDPPACSSETYTEAEDYRIVVSPPPTCYAPTLVANASSTTSGNATWTAPALGTPPAGYQYVISTTNTFPVGPGTPIVGTSTAFTGLTPNTTYYVFVRSDCGAGDFSSWAMASFLTGYCVISSSGSTYYTNNFSTLGGITNITNTASGFSVGGYGNFTAQVVSQAAGGSVSFSATITGGTAGFAIWVDWNNDLDFNDPSEEAYMSNAFVATATGFITVPATASVGNHRMRIVANASTTVPNACGAGTLLEAEDYTFTVSPPLACSGNPSVLSVFIVSMTSSTISWSAATPAPANGYQYYLNTTGTPPVAATGATGTTAAGVTSATITGLVAGTKYYVWVRSNCGGVTGQGTWVGPIIFTQPTCAVGSGTGTTTLGCPTTISGGIGLSGAPAPTINCSTAACATLEALYTPIKETTSYAVTSIAYAPPYQFSCMRNPVSVNVDDRWSPLINLPFNFCFYGNVYNQCVIGSNGVLSFDTTKANLASGYSFANNLPSTVGALFANSIYGVYHDIDPAITGGEVGWELITLNTGCRALIASWNNVAMFSDNTIKYTGMMVLYENTNIIEVYIKEKKIDNNNVAPWNGGNAIVGLQDATGTLATVAPGRNGLDTNWTATNEAWRFTPNGANVPTTVKWYEGVGTAGTVVGTNPTVSVCPAATTTYTAELTYTLCNGLVYKNTAQTTVTVNTNKTWNGSVSTNWNLAANWTPVGIPTAAQSVDIPNVVNDPIVGSGVNALACSINVQTGAILTINSANNITVTNGITVAAGGTFNVKNTANLVQVSNTAINSGNINMERIANLRLQDYCYWSSPVGNLGAGTFPVQSVSPLTPAGYIFKWGTTTPNANGGQGTWISTLENMIPTKGYILRAPSGFTNLAASALTANFIGVPNNGIFSPTIFRGTNFTGAGTQGMPRTITDDNWNLLGNPYPSSIGVNEFLTANGNIQGFVKIWTHGQLPTNITSPFYQSYIANYFPTDYITVNLTAATSAPGDYKIGAGQGFMVLMNPGAAGSNTVTFNNSMRNATFANTAFFRNTSANATTAVEQHRIWLDLETPTGSVNRTVVGYVTDATQAEDRLYDAFTDNKPSENFYSLIDDKPMVIQGRALPFDVNDRVPMGIQTPSDGTYTIAIATVDGLFTAEGQAIYLEDKLQNVIHDLKASPYQFVATQGIINDRFVLRYTNQALNNSDFNLLENNVTIFASNNEIKINSTIESIKDYTVYNVLGQTLATKNNVNANQSVVNSIIKNNQALIVKIVLTNGQTVIKKIVF